MDVNKCFNSFQEIKNYIRDYEKAHFVQCYFRDTKTLDSMCRTKPRCKSANKNLKYYAIVVGCIKGGRKFQSTSKGKRKSSTMKEGCQFKIRFSLSEDGQNLVLVEANEKHNHEVHESLFKHFSKQRRLSPEHRDEVEQLMNLKCNKKLLQHYISNKTGKVVTLRDLTNLNTARIKDLPKNDLQDVVSTLKSQVSSTVEVIVDGQNELLGIFYQNGEMKKCFQCYPEIILCDATYKLNDLRMPLYIMVVIDGNGHCDVVATFLLADESANTIQKMILVFKRSNPSLISTKTIITDKDFTERKVFSQEFSDAKTVLCLFHTLKTFKTKITTTAMGITSDQRQTCLAILQQLAYSRSESEYEKHYNNFQRLACPTVLKYFNENWHIIKEEWVEGLKKHYASVFKIQQHKSFYRELLITLETIRNEKEHGAQMLLARNPVTKFPQDSDESKYLNFLTPYAFDIVCKQMRAAEKVILTEVENENYFIVEKSCGNLTVRGDACTCNFRVDMQLPCKHILAVKKRNGESLYSEELVHKKFTKKNYIETHISRNSRDTLLDSVNDFGVSVVEITKRLTTHQDKWKQANKVCQRLVNVISEFGETKFNSAVTKIEQITKLLDGGKNFRIVEYSNDDLFINGQPQEMQDEIQMEIQEIQVDEPLVPCYTENQTTTSVDITDVPPIIIDYGNGFEECQSVEKSNKDMFPNIHYGSSQNNIPIEPFLRIEEAEIYTENGDAGLDIITNTIEPAVIDNVSIEDLPIIIANDDINLITSVNLPTKMNRRGRPKGIYNTVIGLKKKKRKNST